MNGIEAVIATQVLDATAVGVALMTAVDAAAARSTIGAVPTSRTLTINGTALDLSADRSWTVSGGISSLNGLTDTTQTFQTGTTGTNFGIVSTAGVHTFNLPDASDTARGVVTTGTQAFAGTKTFNGDVRINGTLDFNANNLFNFRLVIGFAAGASRLTFHSINANGSGWGTINSINGWSDGTSWWCKVGGGAWGFGTGVYGFTQGFYSPTANTTRLIGGTNSQVFSVSNTHISETSFERLALQFVTYSSARYAQLACESAGTGIANMNLVLSPRGTGALIAGPVPDGTAVGGNARGQYAIDLQTYRTAATQVASGVNSVVIGINSTASSNHGIAIGNTAVSTGGGNGRSIAIGMQATASGEYAIAIGQASATGAGAICITNEGGAASGAGATAIGPAGATASGTCSIAIGAAVASRTNEVAFGFRHSLFDVRPGAFLLSCKTTDANFTALAGNNIFQSAIAWTTRTGTVIQGILQVLGVKSDGSAVASYTRKVIFKNVGGTITLVQSETIGTDFEDNASTDIEITNATPFFRVKGIASETWRWSGWFGPTLELAYGT